MSLFLVTSPCIVSTLYHFPCTVLIVAWHLSLHVAVTSEAVYELVAEPTQEQQVGESQAEEVVEPVPAEVANLADLQGKPRSITLTLNLQSVIKLCTCALSF